jgi:hypothetical protein
MKVTSLDFFLKRSQAAQPKLRHLLKHEKSQAGLLKLKSGHHWANNDIYSTTMST